MFIRSYIHTLIRPYTHTLIRPYAHTSIRSYVHTLIHSWRKDEERETWDSQDLGPGSVGESHLNVGEVPPVRARQNRNVPHACRHQRIHLLADVVGENWLQLFPSNLQYMNNHVYRNTSDIERNMYRYMYIHTTCATDNQLHSQVSGSETEALPSSQS